MFEKRKYGSKIRYRVTDAISNDMAKKVARDIRASGVGAGVDTWKGQFAIWADKKLSSISFSYFKTGLRDSSKFQYRSVFTDAHARDMKKKNHPTKKAAVDYARRKAESLSAGQLVEVFEGKAPIGFVGVDDDYGRMSDGVLKEKKKSTSKKYGTLEGPEHGGWSAINMTDYKYSKVIVSVRSKVGSSVYHIVETGSKSKILKKYKEYTDGGYNVQIVKFKDTWALGEKEWSGAAGRKYGSKTPKSQVTTASRRGVHERKTKPMATVMELHKFYDNQQPRDRKQALAQAQHRFQISKREASLIYTDWQKKRLAARGVEIDVDASPSNLPRGIKGPQHVETKKFMEAVLKDKGRKKAWPQIVPYMGETFFAIRGGYGHGAPARSAAKYLKKDGAKTIFIGDYDGDVIARIYYTPQVRDTDYTESWTLGKGGRWKKSYSGPKKDSPIAKRKRVLKATISVIPSSEFPTAPNVIMENHEGTSNKMWGWNLWSRHSIPRSQGKWPVDIFWGRIGAKTFSRQTRTFETKGEMEDFISKKFKEKQLKGYKVTWGQGAGSFKY